MKMVIESTDVITTLDGVRCRVWEGTTERGVRVKVFVHRIRARDDADTAELDKELEAQIPPAVFVPLMLIR